MAIDQTQIGQHIQEQMEAIEQDPDVADDLEVGGIITIVELRKEEQQGDQVALTRNLRVRSNRDPWTTIGLLEEGKVIQMRMIDGE
jgi:adenosylmethionine-8-amino-7-oxononanoate aminotransferase